MHGSGAYTQTDSRVYTCVQPGDVLQKETFKRWFEIVKSYHKPTYRKPALHLYKKENNFQ